MRISQLNYFVSVARNKSFTKAAEECFIVQSAMSQQITALEEELGFALFERNTRKVTLTKAGEYYLNESIRLLRQLQKNNETALKISNGILGSLTIGVSGSNQSAHMKELKQFYEENPTIDISFCSVNTDKQAEELIEHRYDLTYTALFNLGGNPQIEFVLEKDCTLCVLMNQSHPFAKKEKITLTEASKATNIFAKMSDESKNMSTYSDLYIKNGIQPQKIIYVQDQNISSLLLDFNIGIAIAPEEIIQSMPKNIVSRPLEDGQFKIRLGWAYAKNNQNPALLKFLSSLIYQKN